MIGRLVRSGWWVVPAAVISVGAILALVVRPGSTPAAGDGRDPSTYGFDLGCLLVSEIVAGGMGRDGLHAVNDPAIVPGSQVATINQNQRGKLLVGDDRIIGVVVNGHARAYPLRLMRWHEVANDVLGGEAIAVSYSGLCDASSVWRRSINGEDLRFGISGLLHNSNTLIYDHGSEEQRSSLWSQISGRAIAGPMACTDTALESVPFDLVTWSDWLDRHPNTEVMTPLPEYKRLYKRDPYHSYFGSQVLHFPVDPMPPTEGPAPKESVVIVELGSARKVFALSALAEHVGHDRGAIDTSIADTEVRIHFTTEPATARIEVMGETDQIPLMRIAFWFAWHAQYPDAPLATP